MPCDAQRVSPTIAQVDLGKATQLAQVQKALQDLRRQVTASEAAATAALGLRPSFTTSAAKPGTASPGRTSDAGFQIGDLVNQMAAKLKVTFLINLSAIVGYSTDLLHYILFEYMATPWQFSVRGGPPHFGLCISLWLPPLREENLLVTPTKTDDWQTCRPRLSAWHFGLLCTV